MLNRVKVVICGKEYVVQTEEAPSYVYSLAKTQEKKEYVDEAGKARIERDLALRENESLKAKIAQLENIVKLKSLKDSLDG